MSGLTESEPAIIHFKSTRKSGFACITLLSGVGDVCVHEVIHQSQDRSQKDSRAKYVFLLDYRLDRYPTSKSIRNKNNDGTPMLDFAVFPSVTYFANCSERKGSDNATENCS